MKTKEQRYNELYSSNVCNLAKIVELCDLFYFFCCLCLLNRKVLVSLHIKMLKSIVVYL
jgi:hypothetical protein